MMPQKAIVLFKKNDFKSVILGFIRWNTLNTKVIKMETQNI